MCRINLASYDQMPESLARFCYVEFTMPATYVSHTTLRSLAVTTGDPPEKYVRYLARHEYVVEIEHTSGPGPAAYVAATESENKPVDNMPPPAEEDESDSDSDWTDHIILIFFPIFHSGLIYAMCISPALPVSLFLNSRELKFSVKRCLTLKSIVRLKFFSFVFKVPNNRYGFWFSKRMLMKSKWSHLRSVLHIPQAISF